MSLKNDKKALVLEDTVISILLFTFFIIVMIDLVIDTSNQYNINMDGNFSDNMRNSSSSVKALSDRMANNTRQAEATTTDTLVTFVSSGISSLQIIYESLGIINDLGATVMREFDIPDSVFYLFIAIVTISITFTIIAALLKVGRI